MKADVLAETMRVLVHLVTGPSLFLSDFFFAAKMASGDGTQEI